MSWGGVLEQHFSQGFLGINSSLLRLESLSGFLVNFYPHFPFDKMLFTNRLELSCFPDFCVCIFKPEIRVWFSLKNPPVERLTTAWSKRLKSCVKIMSMNSISVSSTYCVYLEGEVVVQHVPVPGEELHHVVRQLLLGPVTLAPASFRQLQSCNN